MTPADIVMLLINKAEALRRVGVQKLKMGETEVVLMPYNSEPVEPVEPALEELVEETGDPLTSSATFIGGRVPGYRRRK